MGASPTLQTLELLAGSDTIPSVSLTSASLRRALVWKVVAKLLIIADAPRLDQIVLWQVPSPPLPVGFRTRVEIRHAPELRLIGYLDPARNVLVIGNTVIKGGTKPTPKTMVPSVKVLGLKVRLGALKEAWMAHSFLRCFPGVQTLHIMCDEADATDDSNFKFWKEIYPIDCVSHIKKVTFYGVPWSKGNFEFLKFILEGAYLLEEMTISLPQGTYSGMHTIMIKLKLNSLTSLKWANKSCRMKIQYKGLDFTYDRASDSAVIDPLDCSR